jgi:hypothetical protein
MERTGPSSGSFAAKKHLVAISVLENFQGRRVKEYRRLQFQNRMQTKLVIFSLAHGQLEMQRMAFHWDVSGWIIIASQGCGIDVTKRRLVLVKGHPAAITSAESPKISQDDNGLKSTWSLDLCITLNAMNTPPIESHRIHISSLTLSGVNNTKPTLSRSFRGVHGFMRGQKRVFNPGDHKMWLVNPTAWISPEAADFSG